MNNTTLDEIRKQQIAAMTRKELNAHAYLCEKEQEQYAAELQQLREELEQRTNERNEAAAHAIGWKSICGEVRTELAAKDKVLKYADNEIESAFNLLLEDSFENAEDAGEKVGMVHRTIRSILEQYARSAIVPNE